MFDIAAQFGDNLIRVRKHAGMSQDELSIRASVHRTEISQLERGLRIARIDTLIKLAGSIECDRARCLPGSRGRREIGGSGASRRGAMVSRHGGRHKLRLS